MQLLGPHINVAQQDIVGDNVFDKGRLVVLFLIIGLRAVEGHGGHGAQGTRLRVVPLGKGGVVELGPPALQGLEGAPLVADDAALTGVDRFHGCRPMLPDTAQFVAGHHRPFGIDHTNGPVCAVLHLQDNALKHSAGHKR